MESEEKCFSRCGLSTCHHSENMRKQKDPDCVAECVAAYAHLSDLVWQSREEYYPPHATAPCLIHGGRCPLFKSRRTPLTLSFNWAGTICKGWSTVGDQQRFGDPSERPHASYVAQRAQAAKGGYEDAFFQECVKNYPIVQKLVLPLQDTHHMVYVISEPRKVNGFPSRRPRRLSAGLYLPRPCFKR